MSFVSGHTVRLFGQKKEGGKKTGGASLLLPKVRKNPLIEIIPINTGCLNQCSYCKTKHARGDLGSYPPGIISGYFSLILKMWVICFSCFICIKYLSFVSTFRYADIVLQL